MSKRAEHAYIDGRRYHVTPVGNLPGVTSILSATKPWADSVGIRKWKAKVGPEEADRICREACERGDYVHSAIENTIQGKVVEYSGVESTDAMIVTMNKYVRNYILPDADKFRLEEAMFSKLGYAGSPDCLVKTKEGKIVLYDWKTASRRKTRSMIKDYILQICAYWHMCDERFQEKVDHAKIVICYIGKDGQAETIEHEVTKDDYVVGIETFKERVDEFYGIEKEVGIIW